MSRQFKLKKRHYAHDRLHNMEVKKLYDPNDVVTSVLLQLLNFCLEDIEKLGVDIFRELLEEVDDPDLREQMKTFIYQEANHTRLHRGYCDKLQQCDSSLINIISQAYADYNRIAKESMYRTGIMQDKLYLFTIHELFSSKFSGFFINRYQEKYRELDPYAGYIYLMHSIEEIEHQSVSFDLYMHLFKEHPHARQANLDQFKNFNRNLVRSFTGWAIKATQAWYAENNLPVPNSLEITSQLTAADGIFPNGEFCIEYYQPDFHPSQMNMRHFIDRWELEWEPDLLQRMQ